jgi:hypothetical protein
MVRRVRRVLAVAMLALAAGPAPIAPGDAAAQADPSLRVEWDPTPVPRAGWAIEGRLYNDGDYRVGLVRLQVEVLDEAGKVTATGTGWLHGDVPARGRGYFRLQLPRTGASYRVSVVSFVRVSRDAP